jgi:hypothetical protein
VNPLVTSTTSTAGRLPHPTLLPNPFRAYNALASEKSSTGVPSQSVHRQPATIDGKRWTVRGSICAIHLVKLDGASSSDGTQQLSRQSNPRADRL